MNEFQLNYKFIIHQFYPRTIIIRIIIIFLIIYLYYYNASIIVMDLL